MKKNNNLILDIYDSAQKCSVSDFSELALAKLNNVVQFDSAVIVDRVCAPDNEVLIQSLHFHGTPIDRLQDRHRIYGSEQIDRNGSISTRDLAFEKAYMHRGKSVVTDIEKTFADAATLKYMRKYETAHSLTFVAAQASASSLFAISLWRANKRNEFKKTHSHTADLLLPHVLQARKINRRLNGDRSAQADSSSVALANSDGCLHFVDDKAIALLQLEWKEWTPPLLPRSLMELLRQSKDQTFFGKSISVKASVQEKIICLVIELNGKSKIEVSSTEYRVAKLAAKGLQYKEIARELGVSPATIRNQLHSVYRKLGVANKTALASALSLHSFDRATENMSA